MVYHFLENLAESELWGSRRVDFLSQFSSASQLTLSQADEQDSLRDYEDSASEGSSVLTQYSRDCSAVKTPANFTIDG